MNPEPPRPAGHPHPGSAASPFLDLWSRFEARLVADGCLVADTKSPGDLKRLVLAWTRARESQLDQLPCTPRSPLAVLAGMECPGEMAWRGEPGTRKTVNSAKRLRARFGIAEGPVCAACSKRAACERADRPAQGQAELSDVARLLLACRSLADKPDGGQALWVAEQVLEAVLKL